MMLPRGWFRVPPGEAIKVGDYIWITLRGWVPAEDLDFDGRIIRERKVARALDG